MTGPANSLPEPLLKCTTRHIRIFTARVDKNELVGDPEHLTLDIDPDNEFLWDDDSIRKVQDYFRELVDSQEDNELSDYSLRKIGSLLEDFIRKLLKDGELSYNPSSRVMNYSMGLPRTQELL